MNSHQKIVTNSFGRKLQFHSSKTAIHARATVCIQPRNAKEAMHTQVEVNSVTKPPYRKHFKNHHYRSVCLFICFSPYYLDKTTI